LGSLWNRSGIVERYADDLKAPGAVAYFFSGGTTTPLTVYRDAGESSAHPNPVVADAFGRWPDVFVPYILGYDVQVKTADGVQLTYTQNIPNPDPVELTVTPDPTTSLSTGMVHAELINTTKTGFVRLNGRTMGNASSGGTERANADTSDLFSYLWNSLTDTIAPVSGGRGASAASDFAANKNIILPNAQGSVFIGLDDMGSTAGGWFSGLTFGLGNATTPGSRIGINTLTLDITQMPAHTHSGTTNVESPTHQHTATTSVQSADHTHSGTTNADSPAHSHSFSGTTSTQGAHSHTVPIQTFNPAQGLNASGILSGGSTSTSTDGDHSHTFSGTTGTAAHTHTFTSGIQSANHTHSFTTTDGSHSHTFITSSQGGGQPMNNIPRSLLVTWYIKL